MGLCHRVKPALSHRYRRLHDPSLLSPRAVAPVDPEIAPGHEAACVAQKEHGSSPKLFWCAQSVEHVALGPLLPPLWICLEEGLGHGGNDIARRYGVDTDTVFTPLRSEIPP